MLRTTALLLGLMAFPSVSFAASTYLDCEVFNDTENKVFSVRLDEAGAKVTHSVQSGASFNAEGFFTANTVTYEKVHFSAGLKIKLHYVIDRTSLKVKETYEVGPDDAKVAAAIAPIAPSLMEGSCTVAKIDKRKV